MKLLIQRVTEASVTIDAQIHAAISRGLLVFVGMEPSDNTASLEKALHKIANYRMFEDDQGLTNLSLKEVEGELLLVSQFTLAADTRKGLRPGFSTAMKPEQAQVLFERLVELAGQQLPTVQSGVFGAYMQVALINDGPMTIAFDL